MLSQILNTQSGWISFQGIFFCILNKTSVWEKSHCSMLKSIKPFAIHFHHLHPNRTNIINLYWRKLNCFQLKNFWFLICESFQTCWPDSPCFETIFSSFDFLFLLNSNHFFFEKLLLSLQQYLGLDSSYLFHNYSLWIMELILNWILFSLALYLRIFFQECLKLEVYTFVWRNVLCPVFLIHQEIPIKIVIRLYLK